MKSRRGLSTIVGGVFFVIAATTAIVYITYSMNTVDNFAQSIASNEMEKSNRLNEKFDLTHVNIVGGKLNVTLQNTGNIPVNISKLWVQNKTNPEWLPHKYDIDKLVSPGGTATNIGQGVPLYLRSDKAYDLKLVTDRGNTVEYSINSYSSNIYANLQATPSIVSTDFTTTLTLEVVNNLASNDILTNITPSIACTSKLTIVPGSWPSPATVETLERGDTATFRWVYKATGEDGDTATCTAYFDTAQTKQAGSPAVVKIQDPGFASQSETSLESEGLVCCRTTDDQLVFHAETLDTPPGANNYQTYSGLPELLGSVRQLENQSPLSYFTKNDTNIQIDIPPGDWKLVLVYKSDLVPSTITTNPSMFYLFQGDNSLKDSSGNGITLTTTSLPTPKSAVLTPFGIKDVYAFDGVDDFLQAPFAWGKNDIEGYPDSTVGWFKTSVTTGKKTIYRVGSGVEFYDISVNEQSVEFTFRPDDSAQITKCTSLPIYADGNWHFFAAVRTAATTCKLYVDNLPAIGPIFGASGSGSGKDNVEVSGQPTYIGRSPSSGTEYFNGDIGYIAHWNSYALTGQEVGDLYTKDYGTGSHKIQVKYIKTDRTGTAIQTLNDETFVVPFGDPANTLSSGWNEYTHTTNLFNATDPTQSFHFKDGQRLQIQLTWINEPSRLGLDLDTDDSKYTDFIGSKLVIPPPSTPFPSYFQWSKSQPMIFTVGNTGPNGLWILYSGTRVIFEGLTTPTSYAGLLTNINGTFVTPEDDSMFLDVEDKGVLEFLKPRTVPRLTTPMEGEEIQPNRDYRMYVSIIGYDTQGANVFRTFYVGVVKVTP